MALVRNLAPCLVLALACEGQSTAAPPAASRTEASDQGGSTAARRAPVARSAPDGRCTAGVISTLRAPVEPSSAVAIAIAGDAGLVVWTTGATMHVLPIDAHGAPAGPERRHDARGELVTLDAIGDRFVAVELGRCDDAATVTWCHAARALDRRGEVATPPAVVAVGAAPVTLRRATTGDALRLASSDGSSAPSLARFGVRDGTVVAERIDVRPDRAGAEGRVEILAAAARGSRWAIVWRRGATEDPRSAVHLSTPSGTVVIEALHEALAIESIDAREDGAAMIAAFEFSRPHLFDVDARGDLRSRPRELSRGAALPPPFAERRTAVVEIDGGDVRLRFRDAAGDPAYEAVPIASASGPSTQRPVGDVARAGDGWVVAFVAPEAKGLAVSTRRVRCNR